MARNDTLNNLYSNNVIDLTKNYDMFKNFMGTEDPYIGGFPFLFMTTPNLNLKGNVKNDEFIYEIQKTMPSLYNSLSFADGRPFIPILTNYFKGLNGKDLASRTVDIGETMTGWKQTLPGPQEDSMVSDTVTVKYHETKYLPITKLHKLWMDYIFNVSSGRFTPNVNCIKKNVLDYISSIYYFVIDKDGETILYYSKYTGIAPVSNPYSELVVDIGQYEVKELNIEYSYSYKEDMNPAILSDFNKSASGKSFKGSDSLSLYLPADFNENSGLDKKTIRNNFEAYLRSGKGTPFVTVTENKQINSITPSRKYKLKFVDRKW